MSVMKILTFPDPRLREVAKPVTEFKSPLKKMVEDMLETMYHANGIGLAAPQVGELVRLLVVDTRPRDDEGRRYKNEDQTEMEQSVPQPLVLINPEIIGGEGKTTFDEGCLSVPGYYETVERFNVVDVKAFDVNGKEFRFKTDGLLAICIQHELDHLEGTLFIDHLSFIKSNKIKTQIKKHGYPPPRKDVDEDDAGPEEDLEKAPARKSRAKDKV